MRTLLLFLLSVASAFAQNVAVLSHEAANTPEFRDGIPALWPYRIVEVGKARELPKDLPGTGWVLLSHEELRTRMESLSAAKETWNNREEPSVTDRKQRVAAIISDLRAIRQSSGTLPAAQLSAAVRQLATAILFLIEEGRAQ